MDNKYYSWKLNNLKNPQGYFVIFNEFYNNDLLVDIPDNALRLYIYFGLNHYYKSNKVYYNQSITDISKYFNKSNRTINYWIQDLIDLNLIKRNRASIKDISNTEIIPYDLNLKDNINYDTLDYYEWIQLARKNNKLFFPIFNNFKENRYLANLSGGALKLYIFLGIHSKYNTGESRYSIPTISKKLNKSERSISYSIEELKKEQLIFRKQKQYNVSSTTYLLRY